MDQTSVNTWDSLVSPPSLVTLHNIISMNQGSNVTKISHFLLEQQQKLMLVLGSLFMKFLFPIKVMTHVLAPGTMVVRESGVSVTYFRQLRRYLQQCASVTVSRADCWPHALNNLLLPQSQDTETLIINTTSQVSCALTNYLGLLIISLLMFRSLLPRTQVQT